MLAPHLDFDLLPQPSSPQPESHEGPDWTHLFYFEPSVELITFCELGTYPVVWEFYCWDLWWPFSGSGEVFGLFLEKQIKHYALYN